MSLKATEFGREEFVWLLAGLCQLFRLPFDPALALQQFPPPYGRSRFLSAAQALGFVFEDFRPAEPVFPSVARLRSGAPALLLKREGGKVLYTVCGSPDSAVAPANEIERLFEPDILAVRRQPADPAQEHVDALLNRPAFGFRWFVPQLLKHKRIWRDVLAASLAIQLMALATPLFTQVVIDKIIVHQTQSTLIAVAVGLAMFLVFSAGMSWLRQYLVLHTGNRIDAVLGMEAFSHLFRLPVPYFDRRPTGTLVVRLHAVETIREFVSGAAVSLVLDAPFLVIFLAIMFWYSWQLSLIAVVILAVIALLSLAVTPIFRAKLDRQFLLGARNQAFVTEYVSGLRTVKALQLEPQLDARYGGYLADYLASGFSTRQTANTYSVAANALEQAMTVAILVFGALIVMQNAGFTIGMLVAFQMFASRLSQPLLRLVGLWTEFQQARLAVKRLGDVMNNPTEPYASVPSGVRAEGPGRIELQGLSFRYSDAHPWLYRNLTLAIKPGSITVVTGPSGCGKSTLVNILLGFYPPRDGTIKLDGYDIRQLSANELRAFFGVVPQETVLFSGTVLENLRLSNPNATLDEIVEAAKQAEIHDAIEALPQRYQTALGEQGVGLSGGQRQRIAIARALLKRPKVLVFDEATSGLDAPVAEALARTVNQLKGKATVLFVAHYVPKGLQVDQVFSFGAGPRAPQAQRIRLVEDAPNE